MSAELHKLDIAGIKSEIASGEISPEDVLQYFQNRIGEKNKLLNAFLAQDAVLPGRIDPSSSPIAGIPFAVKDNIVIQGQPARAGSKILEDFISPYTATAADHLIKADGIVIGRTNCDEFGMGSSTENSAYGPTRNPWDLERVPGGSSGGSAAAVAAGLVPYALGSDTGGSIRQPASFCGIVGVKPTYGRVSRYGLISLASSLDTIGTFTKTITDAATVFESLAGYDPMDSTSADREVQNYTSFLDRGVEGLRIGVPREYFGEGLDRGVSDAVRQAIKQLEKLGAKIVDIDLPSSPYGLAAYYIILPVEASSNLSRYDGVRYGRRAEDAGDLLDMYLQTRGEGLGAEVKRRIMLGTYASSSGYYDAYYKQALKVRDYIRNDFARVFETVDCIVGPTAPTAAYKLGEMSDDPLSMYLGDIYTVTANIAGIPAVSIPCGFSNNLPVGVQIMAPWFREDMLFQAAGAYENSTDWHLQHPNI